MRDDLVITIGRQYGSGGREIGKALAALLNVPFYDKELITLACEQSGISRELLESYDEQPTNSLLYSLSMGNFALANPGAASLDLPLNHKVFLAQFDAIRKIADQGSCVIVGRCADYVLAEYPHVLNVYIYAPLEKRVERIMQRSDMTQKAAQTAVEKTDKKRANYYSFYTNKRWGAAESYHLCLDSSAVGEENAAQIIREFAERMR